MINDSDLIKGLIELITQSGDFSIDCNKHGWSTSYISPNGYRTGEMTLTEHGVRAALEGSVERYLKNDYHEE